MKTKKKQLKWRPLKNWEKQDADNFLLKEFKKKENNTKECIHCGVALFKSSDSWTLGLCNSCVNMMYEQSNQKGWVCETCGKLNSFNMINCPCQKFFKPSVEVFY